MELETKAFLRKLKSVQQKEESRAFAKTQENTATLETHDPTAPVTAMLEKPMKQDGTLGYIEMLCTEISAGRATLNAHAELSKL